MLQSLKLVGVGPAPEMEMQFAPRLNVLTGDNGLGKSLFLETIWYVLTGNWAGDQAYPNGDLDGARIEYQIHENRVEEAGFAKMENRWHWAPNESDSLVISARVDGSVSIWDPLPSKSAYRKSIAQALKMARGSTNSWLVIMG